jgi:hypothetical protein
VGIEIGTASEQAAERAASAGSKVGVKSFPQSQDTMSERTQESGESLLGSIRNWLKTRRVDRFAAPEKEEGGKLRPNVHAGATASFVRASGESPSGDGAIPAMAAHDRIPGLPRVVGVRAFA